MAKTTLSPICLFVFLLCGTHFPHLARADTPCQGGLTGITPVPPATRPARQARSPACESLLNTLKQQIQSDNAATTNALGTLQHSVDALAIPPAPRSPSSDIIGMELARFAKAVEAASLINPPDPWLRGLNIANDISTCLLALLAGIAGYLAFKQLQANTYMAMMNLWNSLRVERSRSAIINLEAKFLDPANAMDDIKKAVITAGGNAPDYIAATLLHMQDTNRDKWLKSLYVLVVMENIGVLCKSGSLGIEAMAHNISFQVVRQIDMLTPYIRSKQTGHGGDQVFINAMYLYDQCSAFLKKKEAEAEKKEAAAKQRPLSS